MLNPKSESHLKPTINNSKIKIFLTILNILKMLCLLATAHASTRNNKLFTFVLAPTVMTTKFEFANYLVI